MNMKFKDFAEINPKVKLIKGEEYPFVEMGEITPGRRYVTTGQNREFGGGGTKFESGDTLFARITPCLENGKISQFKASLGTKAFGSTEFFVFRGRQGVSDSSFIYYFSSSDLIKKTAEKSMSGASGRQRADLKAVEEFEFTFPPLEIQRKIASTLSAYDDLIENNARRIKTLEEMAQMIYREWFVNFRFPGYEKAKMVDGSIGTHSTSSLPNASLQQIPEGWVVKPVTEAVDVNPRMRVPKEAEKPFLPMGCLSNDSMLVSNVEYRSGNSGSKFKNGDTLFARITPCLENGKTGFVQFLPTYEATAFGSTEFIVLRSRELCPEYVYLMARSDEFRDNAIKSMSGASGRQRVSEKCFEQFFIAQPDSQTLKLFAAQVSPMFKAIHVLAKKNQNLRLTRDLLLPKLISGEVAVSDVTF